MSSVLWMNSKNLPPVDIFISKSIYSQTFFCYNAYNVINQAENRREKT